MPAAGTMANQKRCTGRLSLFIKTLHKWGFPKIGVPQNGWFIKENPIKMDDLGVPPFQETPIYCICIGTNKSD